MTDAEPPAPGDDLAAAIGERIDACAGLAVEPDDEVRHELEALAVRAARRQRERIEAYRNLWTAPRTTVRRGGRGNVASWLDTPAVPCRAFKEPALRLWTDPPAVVFRSSGTTAGRESRSEHHHPHPDLYRRVVDASFPPACLDDRLLAGRSRAPILSLIPPLQEVPDSSLGFMVDHIIGRWGADDSRYALGAAGLDEEPARRFLSRHAEQRRPVLVLSTALALGALLDALDEVPLVRPLAPGTVVFETGGFKGRERQLDRADLLTRTQRLLGVGAERIVREYGMTELTSQAYTRVLRGGDPDTFFTPPWLFWHLVDPATGAATAPGEAGQIAFFDLGNVGSICHVLTEDVGRATRDGGFELLGRASEAELRGCSLTAEEMLR